MSESLDKMYTKSYPMIHTYILELYENVRIEDAGGNVITKIFSSKSNYFYYHFSKKKIFFRKLFHNGAKIHLIINHIEHYLNEFFLGAHSKFF